MISNRLLGAVCLILGAAFIWGAANIRVGFIVDPLGPRTFPMIIGAVLVLASLYVLLRPDSEPDWPSPGRWLEVGGAVAVLIIYALMLEPLGFVIATALAASTLSWRLGSRPEWAFISGIGISFSIYAIFHLILGLSLAKGPLGF